MSSLKQTKKADPEIKFSVFGYIRRYEKKFKYNIPSLIKYSCLNYYYLHEYFTIYGRNITISNPPKNTIITSLSSNGNFTTNTLYGNVVIDRNDTSISEYIWTFKIWNLLQHSSFIIGIDQSQNKLNKKFLNSDFSSIGLNPNNFYAFGSKGRLYCKNKTNGNNRSNYEFGKKWRKKDLISIILSVSNRTLELIINNKCAEIIYDLDLKNKKYYLAIAVTSSLAEIELSKFEPKRTFKYI